ncbi:MAG: phage integrase N-terminal SAM-like domain-containing protein [Luteimonas sp.]
MFLNFVREFMTTRRYARRTIDTYEHWIRFYILYHGKKHPSQMAEPEVGKKMGSGSLLND